MRRLVHDAEGLNTAVRPVRPDQLVTPVGHFFTRSHAPIPQIDPATWQLEVGGLVEHPRRFSFEELVALPKRKVDATLVCAGLRREEFLSLGPLPGELPGGRSRSRVQREINPQDPRDVSAGVALSEVPLNAVILSPAPDQRVPADRLEVRGWAMGSGGRRVTAVQLSPNGGQDWIQARITVEGTAWTWTCWEAAMELPPGRHILVVKATDATRTIQPATVGETWNVKGYSNNAWHRVAIHVE